MAISTTGIFSQAQLSRMASATSTNNDTIFQILVDNAINTAIAAGAYTCNVSTAAASTRTLQDTLNTLKQAGYTCTIVGTTLTTTW